MDESRISKLLRSLPRPVANSILGSAAINKAVIEGETIDLRPDEVLMLMPYLLRVIKITDEQFSEVLEESGATAGADGYHPPEDVVIIIPFASNGTPGKGIPVTELASGSVIVWELALRVASTVNTALRIPVPPPPPELLVQPGSSVFSFGGGSLVAAGVAFIVAAFANVPQIPSDPALYGGAFLSSLGVIDMAVNWYKVIKEGKLHEAQTRKVEQEISEQGVHSTPASSLVPLENIRVQSREYGLDPLIGTHLLNQVLATYQELIRTHGGVRPSVAAPKSKTLAARAGSAR